MLPVTLSFSLPPPIPISEYAESVNKRMRGYYQYAGVATAMLSLALSRAESLRLDQLNFLFSSRYSDV
jgi:hypothetical protein